MLVSQQKVHAHAQTKKSQPAWLLCPPDGTFRVGGLKGWRMAMPNGPGGGASNSGSGGPAGFGNISNGSNGNGNPLQISAPLSGISSTPMGADGLPANATRSMFPAQPAPANRTLASYGTQGSSNGSGINSSNKAGSDITGDALRQLVAAHMEQPVPGVPRPAYANHQAPAAPPRADNFDYSPYATWRAWRPTPGQTGAAQQPVRPLQPSPHSTPIPGVPAPPATPKQPVPITSKATAAASPLVTSASTPSSQSAARPVAVFKNPLDKYGSPPPASKRRKIGHTENGGGSGSGSENNTAIKTSPTMARSQLTPAGSGLRTGFWGGSSPMTPTQRVTQKPMAPRQRPVPSGFKQSYENNQIILVLDDDDDDDNGGGDIPSSVRSSAPPPTQVSSH